MKEKIKILQQGEIWKDKKIKNLTDLIGLMSTKGLIDNQTEQLLSDSFDGISKVLFSNKLLNNGRKLLVVTIVN